MLRARGERVGDVLAAKGDELLGEMLGNGLVRLALALETRGIAHALLVPVGKLSLEKLPERDALELAIDLGRIAGVVGRRLLASPGTCRHDRWR